VTAHCHDATGSTALNAGGRHHDGIAQATESERMMEKPVANTANGSCQRLLRDNM
jgi:hypothetical protein